jgi:histidyl-tRNA synthetase
VAKQQFQSLRGMYDLLPEQTARYDYLIEAFRKVAEAAGYVRIETPLLEDTKLFERGVGSDTDAVSKEMYSFKDRSDNDVSLRPEPTAGIVRSFIEHGMGSWPQPVKLYFYGPIFRYDRPQAGRQRQFNQFDLEANSNKIAEIDRGRIKTNPLRVLDSKEASTQAVLSDAPQTLNYLCEECQAHFAGVLEYLDDLGVSYELNPLLVRGLDYYTRTVFEFYGEREGAQAAVGGGGRYDLLVEQLGGQPTPAVGFGLGLERILIELEAAGASPVTPDPQRVFVASLGEPARLAAFRLIEQLLDAGVPAVGSVDRGAIGAQLARADKLGVPYAIIIGQKEVREETVILRDMASGAQEILPINGIVAELRARFGVQ